MEVAVGHYGAAAAGRGGIRTCMCLGLSLVRSSAFRRLSGHVLAFSLLPYQGLCPLQVFRGPPVLLRRPHSSSSPGLRLSRSAFYSRSFCRKRVVSAMDQSSEKSTTTGTAAKTEVTGATEAELLQAFYGIPNIDKAWTSSFRRGSGGVDVVVAMSQVNLHANAKRTFISTVYIPNANGNVEDYHWSPFPFELSGALLIVPSPSGTKLLIVRKADPVAKEGAAVIKLEIWGPGQLLKELFVAPSVHGSLYSDGWFEGVSWSHDEESIAYVAEEPFPPLPVFGQSMFATGQSSNRSEAELDASSWKGQGDWIEDWGESYTGKRRPMLFVAGINSGGVQRVEGIPKDISVGQVVWAPAPPPGEAAQQLIFVGWPSYATNFSTARKLGMKYCYNRPCALYAIDVPSESRDEAQVAVPVKLTGEVSSAIIPRFSPDGKQLVFVSANAAVDSGVHCATNSLYSIDWPADGVVTANMLMREVVPVVMSPEGDAFPGLYVSNIVPQPWLSDGSTLLLTSAWRSMQVILAINTQSGTVARITPHDTIASWSLLGVQDDVVIAVCSSPTSPPCLKLGNNLKDSTNTGLGKEWNWSDINVPSLKFPPKVETALSSMTYELLQVPLEQAEPAKSDSGGSKPSIECVFVSPRIFHSKQQPQGAKKSDIPPLIVVLHGGPHSVSQTTYSRVLAFLSALGFSLLHVNYRGSIGYGEEVLQSLRGNVGRQDVGDVLLAVEHVISKGLADRERIGVLGGSHGGFLTSHLIGQAPDAFVTGVLRNPVCNLSSMIGVTDIPDWCYVETFGQDALSAYSDVPSVTDLSIFYKASPIAHLSKVKVPTLFLLGAQDRRVPASNGLQYVQALRARGLEVKVIVFPEDMHAIDRPQSEFESFLNVGTWFKRFLLNSAS